MLTAKSWLDSGVVDRCDRRRHRHLGHDRQHPPLRRSSACCSSTARRSKRAGRSRPTAWASCSARPRSRSSCPARPEPVVPEGARRRDDPRRLPRGLDRSRVHGDPALLRARAGRRRASTAGEVQVPERPRARHRPVRRGRGRDARQHVRRRPRGSSRSSRSPATARPRPSAVELAASCLAFESGTIPRAPLGCARPSAAARPVRTPRKPGIMLKSSIGMGGHNSVIVLDDM